MSEAKIGPVTVQEAMGNIGIYCGGGTASVTISPGGYSDVLDCEVSELSANQKGDDVLLSLEIIVSRRLTIAEEGDDNASGA